MNDLTLRFSDYRSFGVNQSSIDMLHYVSASVTGPTVANSSIAALAEAFVIIETCLQSHFGAAVLVSE